MSSTKPKDDNGKLVSFVVTGFGPFRDAKDNPTTVIALGIQEYLTSIGETALSSQTTTRIIETSAQAARQEVESMMNTTSRTEDDDNNNNITVYLHLGVNYKGTQFQLEQCAYNDATFRIPDERRYQPRNVCIEESADLGCVLQTSLDLESIRSNVLMPEESSQDTCPIIISTDPGRFVCNYTYYCSLQRTRHCQDDTVHSLFVHVPPFSVVPQEEQMKVVVQIIKCIEQQLTSTPTPIAS